MRLRLKNMLVKQHGQRLAKFSINKARNAGLILNACTADRFD